MTPGKKSLTDPPKNLKEAIDWVIQIKDDNEAIKGLAKELQELLKHDGSEVAMKVLDRYRLVSESVIKGLEDANSKIQQTKEKFYFTYTALNNLSQGLKPFFSGSAAISTRDVEKVKAWVSSIKDDELKQLITGFAEGLKTFVAQGTGILQASNNSAYNSAPSWNTLTPSAKTDCAAILLGIMPVVYIGLTYLYWQCDGTGGWTQEKLDSSSGSDQGTLKQYMEALGYKENLNNKTGKSLVDDIMNSMFSNELRTAYGLSQTHYFNFLKALHEKALDSTPPNSSAPLTSLYALSYYYITNFLYDVQSSNPATPSFAGYSGLSALAGGAYGFNLGGLGTFMSALLAVTGKDGQDSSSQDGTDALAGEVEKLLESVENSGTGLSTEQFKQVKDALGTDSGNGNGLIGKLAEGIQQFIGYDSRGKLTGGGIVPSNIATHRLCDATIAFTIGVLEGCKRDTNLKNDSEGLKRVGNVISALHGKYGTGTHGLVGVAGTVKSELRMIKRSNIKDFVGQLGTAFDKLKDVLLKDASTLANKVGGYLDAVFKAGKASPVNVTTQLQQLVRNASEAYDASNLTSQISSVKNALTPPGSQGFAKNVLQAGTNAFMGALKMSNYTRMDYDASTLKWSNEIDKAKTCAKIFLGCLPLYYQALTYIYWGCHDKGGGWNAMTLGGGALRSYFDSQGLLSPYVDRSKTSAHIADSALKKFSEFGTAASSSLSTTNFPYASFTTKLQEKVTTNGNHLPTDCPLSALFYGASCYFRYQQITNAKSAFNTPKTIREMLYFLAALQFSSAYAELNNHVDTVLNPALKVADSSKPASGGNDTLSADQLKEYFRASCAFSSSVLGLIQGPGVSEKSEPWLHELFGNSTFNFTYPSGATLFSKVSSYAYALQFQLLFLYQQCSNNGVKCGWQ
ncbi:variant erythrocyte surface antigen-1 family protein [Babesia caballi]|uniref:Variant erythrocyte surface antigen-1 family protein n=1 Tax=Babesia caballi TaxID=5871 RepID=A0AAV4M5I9_BABCB|nr:variant erythrocyte surface antigen-1 family protein [Babesia caballi]